VPTVRPASPAPRGGGRRRRGRRRCGGRRTARAARSPRRARVRCGPAPPPRPPPPPAAAARRGTPPSPRASRPPRPRRDLRAAALGVRDETAGEPRGVGGAMVGFPRAVIDEAGQAVVLEQQVIVPHVAETRLPRPAAPGKGRQPPAHGADPTGDGGSGPLTERS